MSDRIDEYEAAAEEMLKKLSARSIDNGWVNSDNMRTLAEGCRYLVGEVRSHRSALAYEAAVLEAQTEGVKALGKGRSQILARSVDRMRRTAAGQYAYHGVSYLSLVRAMSDAEKAVDDAA